jgi:hypothetical protein
LAGRIPKFSGLAFFCNLSMSIVDGNRWNIFHMRTPKYIKRVSPRCSRWSFTNFQAGSLCIYFGVSIVQYEPSWCMISLGRFGHAWGHTCLTWDSGLWVLTPLLHVVLGVAWQSTNIQVHRSFVCRRCSLMCG